MTVRHLSFSFPDAVNQLNQILIDAGRLDDLKRATKDKEYQNKLIEELVTPMSE